MTPLATAPVQPSSRPCSIGRALAMQGAALLTVVLVMTACDKKPSSHPAPVITTPQQETTPATVGGPDPSVPAAASVVAPGAVPPADPTAGRMNSTMTRGEESSSMPMPGQNNDHSAPVSPAKRASGP